MALFNGGWAPFSIRLPAVSAGPHTVVIRVSTSSGGTCNATNKSVVVTLLKK